MPSMEWRRGSTSSDVHDLTLERGMVCDVTLNKVADTMVILTALDPATGRTARMIYKTLDDVAKDRREAHDEH